MSTSIKTLTKEKEEIHEELEMMKNVITSHALILDIQLLTDNKAHIINLD